MSIVFSIRAFVVEGQLAGVRTGDPREVVHAHLGPPDEQVADAEEDTEIWRYGNFEILFSGETASKLSHHHLDHLQAGPGRELDAWILGGPAALDRDAVVARLVAEQVPFVFGRDYDDRRLLQVRAGLALCSIATRTPGSNSGGGSRPNLTPTASRPISRRRRDRPSTGSC
ncbi:hypothetical protein [Nannocystis pusilla]|uniref:hypothetical protein n=1 Tax=Nannocystis pusilla TaxID=889268 RepID=UPI003B824925